MKEAMLEFFLIRSTATGAPDVMERKIEEFVVNFLITQISL